MKQISTPNERGRSFLYFTLVGIFNTLFNVLLFDVLLFSGLLDASWANFVSLLISIILSYFLNKYLVFKDDERFNGVQLLYFMIGTFLIQVITQHSAVWLLGEVYIVPGQIVYAIVEFARLPASEYFVVMNTAKIIGVLISMLVTYLFYNKVIFIAKVRNPQ